MTRFSLVWVVASAAAGLFAAGCGGDDATPGTDAGSGLDAARGDSGGVDGGGADGGGVDGTAGGESCGPATCGAGTFCCDHCSGFCAPEGSGPACRPPGDPCDDAGSADDAGTPGDAGAPDDAGTPGDAGPPPDAGPPYDAGGVMFSDAGPLACAGTALGDFSRACGADGDCVVVMHQVSCCGTLFAFSIASSEYVRYGAAEGLCASMWPACGCAAGPTTVEDGSTLSGSEPARAHCVAGTCRAFGP